ncbi:MAG TPA: 7-carboxy-7-deazaguanine synthase QueE, partial [Candidatus Cloacimonadota bacterium]|nr:7-carboxy-7-deazaguanine synthase QueE [Candidatus Cloacimonadota bacterium]
IAEYPCKLVELTGGEPLWQEASIPLMIKLLEQDYQVLLETNGSLDLSEVPLDVVKIVDVKCPGSGMGDSFMKHNLLCMSEQDELKFVLSNYPDYAFAKAFLREHQIGPRAVHFSPVPSLLSAETLASWILEDGLKVKLSLQLHKILNLR